MNIGIQDIKVKIKILSSSSKTLAQASVTLFDCWTEHGWRIMTSEHLHPKFQESIWIQSPCYRAGVTWKEMVFIDDKNLYELVQTKIYDSYSVERSKHRQETPIHDQDISRSEKIANEIPF